MPGKYLRSCNELVIVCKSQVPAGQSTAYTQYVETYFVVLRALGISLSEGPHSKLLAP